MVDMLISFIEGFASSARQRGLCEDFIRLPLDRAADDVKGNMPPENHSHLITRSVTAQICFVVEVLITSFNGRFSVQSITVPEFMVFCFPLPFLCCGCPILRISQR